MRNSIQTEAKYSILLATAKAEIRQSEDSELIDFLQYSPMKKLHKVKQNMTKHWKVQDPEGRGQNVTNSMLLRWIAGTILLSIYKTPTKRSLGAKNLKSLEKGPLASALIEGCGKLSRLKICQQASKTKGESLQQSRNRYLLQELQVSIYEFTKIYFIYILKTNDSITLRFQFVECMSLYFVLRDHTYLTRMAQPSIYLVTMFQ